MTSLFEMFGVCDALVLESRGSKSNCSWCWLRGLEMFGVADLLEDALGLATFAKEIPKLKEDGHWHSESVSLVPWLGVTRVRQQQESKKRLKRYEKRQGSMESKSTLRRPTPKADIICDRKVKTCQRTILTHELACNLNNLFDRV